MGSSQNSRVNALGAVNAGFEAWRTGEQLGELGETLANNPMQGMTQASVSITYGQQKSEERQHTQGNTIEKSQINSDGKVRMHIQGKGDDSKLAITAADVAGKGGTELFGEGGVLIGALDENHLERSQNKSSGFNAGVAMTMGQNGFSYGLTAGGNKGKGYGNGDSQSWVGSQVGSRDSKTIIKTNRTLDIEGSQVHGKKVSVTAENLNIKSLQDTAHYEGKQENISGQVTVGAGASVSGSYSKSKVKNDYASVNQQAGIFTGDEGYDIHVSNHTHLEGGLITSTEKAEAEGKNHFSTGTITQKDIENHANSKGSSVGVSGGVAMNFATPLGEHGAAQSSKTVKDKDGNDQLAMGGESLQGSMAVGMGSTSESASSVTKSGINTKNIEIRNETAQQQLTGKSVEEMKAELNTDITTDTMEARSGKLENRFDKDKMLKELNIQVKVTQEFRKNAFSTIDAYVEPKQAELREKIKLAKTEEEKTALYDEIYKLQYQKRLLQTTVGLVAGSPELAITQGTLQLAATKMREESLENSRKFKGIYEKDSVTGKLEKRIDNVSYDSGYFDGVKLGGVRIDLDAICGKSNTRCENNVDGSVIYKGDKEKLKTYADAINPKINPDAEGMYGATGGFQPVQGGWYLPFATIPYKKGSISDNVVESFAGTHDYLGGQVWGWYDKLGNTSRNRGFIENKGSAATAALAIPVAAPFAVSDLMSQDMMEVLMKIGGQQ